MHGGEDTAPYGYAAGPNERESTELYLIAARAEASRFEAWGHTKSAAANEHDESVDEPEPDWNALRARAEAQPTAPAPKFQPKRLAAMELERAAEQCRAARAALQAAEQQYQYAESDAEAELAAQRYERAHARLAEAEDLLEKAQEAMASKAPLLTSKKSQPTGAAKAPLATSNTILPAQVQTVRPAPALEALPAYAAPAPLTQGPLDPFTAPAVFLNPSIAPAASTHSPAPSWETSEFEASPVRRKGFLPKLLGAAVVLALGAGGVLFMQHRAAEAERTARAEKLLQEMHAADAAREEAERVRKEAEAQAAIAAEAKQKALAAAPIAAAALAPDASSDEEKVARAAPRPKRAIAAARKRKAKQSKARKAKSSGGSSVADKNDPLFGL